MKFDVNKIAESFLTSISSRSSWEPQKDERDHLLDGLSGSVRYHIMPELWKRYTPKIIDETIHAMMETKVFPDPWPADDKITTVRVDYRTLSDEGLVVPFEDDHIDDHVNYLDFHYCHDIVRGTLKTVYLGVTSTVSMFSNGLKHLSASAIAELVESCKRRQVEEAIRRCGIDHGYKDLATWISGNWFHSIYVPPFGDIAQIEDNILPQHAMEMLIVAQHDRSIHQVEVMPSKLSKLGIGKKNKTSRYDPLREITLYCPKRIYQSDGTSTHASPHAHPRSGHWKMQPYGKGRAERKRIYIEMYWVNLAPGEDPGNGPTRRFRLRGVLNAKS